MKREHPAVPAAYLIERPALSKKVLAGHANTFTKFEERFLSAQIKEFRKGLKTPIPLQPARPLQPKLDFDQIITEEKAKFLRFLPEFVPVPIGHGTRVFSPPYDNSWATGTGIPLAHWDGRPLSMATEGGSTSGFCIYLSSPTQVFATVKFSGTYSFNWVSLDDRPELRVTGGLGACIFRGNDPTPAWVRRSTLFTVRAPRAFSGDKGDGPLSSVLVGGPGPSPGTFASWLLPINLLMEPAVKYAVWLWCWHAALGVSDAPFLSFVGCSVPTITVTTSEPYFPPIH